MSEKEELGNIANSDSSKHAPSYDLTGSQSNAVGNISSDNYGSAPSGMAPTPEQESFMIRMGLSAKSYQKRHYGPGIVELDRRMKPRHLNMIAIGGSIGAGFFVGSGSALHTGVSHCSFSFEGKRGVGVTISKTASRLYAANIWQGPGSLLIDFLIIGIMMFNVVYALGELAVMFPVSGGFYTYSARFIDPTWGFAMGWN